MGVAGLVALMLITPVVSARPLRAQTTAVVITSPVDEDRVRGRVTITATAPPETTEVRFEVALDGGDFTLVHVDTDPTDGWSATWDSNRYTGSALLRATAVAGDALTMDEVRVFVDNSPPEAAVRVSQRAFSPNGDGRKDSTRVKVTASELSKLTLEVVDRDGTVRRRWTSSNHSTELVVTWDGRGTHARVAGGRYSLRATVVDGVGHRTTAARGVVIDTRAPRIRRLRIGPPLFTSTGTLTARYSLRDRSRRFRVGLHVADRVGHVRSVGQRSPRTGEIRFRTVYSNGNPLYPGRYAARLRVVDDAGNVRTARSTLWRMHRPVRGRVFERLEGVGRKVSLTFDDCNHTGAWYRILSILKSFGVKATFFCSGAQVVYDREVALATVRQGHAIGSHGWDHALLSHRSRADAEWRIRADARLWWDIARDTTAPYYRPAYGGYNRGTVAGAGATGHGRVIMWDVDSLDYSASSSSAIVGRVLRETRSGSIVLMHVLDQTAEALPAILRGLTRRNLHPVDIHRFFRAAGYR